MIKRVFYFSYVDRYSLIALGTHYPLILVYQWLGLENKYLIAFCVLAIMPEVIWIFKKYFPYFTVKRICRFTIMVLSDGQCGRIDVSFCYIV